MVRAHLSVVPSRSLSIQRETNVRYLISLLCIVAPAIAAAGEPANPPFFISARTPSRRS